jgi:hypothetical protein
VNFGFFADQDTTRYCFLRLRRLKAALKDVKVVDALVDTLGLPAETAALSKGKKLAAIDREIERLRATKTSRWFAVPAPEVLAASIFGAAKLAGDAVDGLFNNTRDDQSIAAAVLNWVKGSGLKSLIGLPFGTERVDLVGYRIGFLSGPRVLAIQVRNEVVAIERALEILPAFTPYTHASYLACTPAAAAAYLEAHAVATHAWDGDLIRRKLQASGSGLLLVEGAAVSQAILAKERTLDTKTLETLAATLKAVSPADLSPRA